MHPSPPLPSRRAHQRFLAGVQRRVAVLVVLLRRVASPLAALSTVFVAGTLGYFLLGLWYERGWSLLDCAFMTSVTLSSVGYHDVLGAATFTAGKLYTMGLILSGMGAMAYSISALTAFIVEGYLGTLFKEARLEREIEHTHSHTIICGAGTTGIHVIGEHLNHGAPIVVVDQDRSQIAAMAEAHPRVLHIVGDATDEDVLTRAGIARANALVAALGSDKDNMFLVVTAKFLRPHLRIVARCSDHDAVGKFRAAGATHVVSPSFIGGLRMASQALRPHVVDFLDDMLRSTEGARVSECVVAEASEVANRTIGEARLREKVGLQIVALRPPGGGALVYSPGPDQRLTPGTVVVVIGPQRQARMLEDLVAGPAAG